MNFKLCVMGNPIDQSHSPWIHEQFAKQFNLAILYTTIQPDVDSFPAAIQEFRHDNGFGFNVAAPFKQEAFNMSSYTSARATTAKSVNTVVFGPEGVLYGDNTDGIGLLNDLTHNLKYALFGKTILILGAGGAVRGVLRPLLSHAPATIVIANRTVEKANALAQEFKSYGNIVASSIDDLKNQSFDIIIDGTAWHSPIILPKSLLLADNNLCYDMKYNSTPTPFMVWAEFHGGKIITDGLGMLIEQAAEAFYIWTGKKPNTQAVLKLAKDTFYSVPA